MLSVSVHCGLQFDNSDINVCVGQFVKRQCTVIAENNEVHVLTWIVRQENGAMFGGSAGFDTLRLKSDKLIGGVFTAKQKSLSPLVSSISFTAQPNINGYNITCEDTIHSKSEYSIISIGMRKYDSSSHS